MVAFMRHPLLNGSCALDTNAVLINYLDSKKKYTVANLSFNKSYLDVYNITLLVDAHVGGQRDWACYRMKSSVRSKIICNYMFVLK